MIIPRPSWEVNDIRLRRIKEKKLSLPLLAKERRKKEREKEREKERKKEGKNISKFHVHTLNTK